MPGLRHRRRTFTMADRQYSRLKLEALKLQISVSEYLRRLIDRQLPPETQPLTSQEVKEVLAHTDRRLGRE